MQHDLQEENRWNDLGGDRASESESRKPIARARCLLVGAQHEPEKHNVQLAVPEVAVDESKRQKQHQSVKAGGCPAVVKQQPRGGAEHAHEKHHVEREPECLARRHWQHREREEQKRDDRSVEIPVRILEPIDPLAAHRAFGGALVHLEVAHALAQVMGGVRGERQGEHGLPPPRPRRRLGTGRELKEPGAHGSAAEELASERPPQGLSPGIHR